MCVLVEFIDCDTSHDIDFHLSSMVKDSCVYKRIYGAMSAYPYRTIGSTFIYLNYIMFALFYKVSLY